MSHAESLVPNSIEHEIRIAIMSSFTLNGLEKALAVKCAGRKVRCHSYLSGYDQYNQDILQEESSLYKFKPDLSFLVLDSRSILKNLFYFPYSVSVEDRKTYVDDRVNEILNLIKSFTRRSQSKLILSNLSVPTYSPYGICETKTEYGFQEMVLDLNRKLFEITKDEPSVYLYDFNGFVTRFGEYNVFDYRQFLWGDIKIALNYIPYLAEEIMGYIKPLLGLNRKCIVLDLDNTLWGGIVGEDGFDGIELDTKSPGLAFMEFQRHLLALHQRGIILAINSKNNPEEALRVIRQHPNMLLREDKFAGFKINWNDKISNMKELAEEMNIGLDSIIYIDDDPVNREIMSSALPQVLTVDLPKDPSLYATTIMRLNDLHVLAISNEDLKRGEMYVQQRQRAVLEKTVTNLDEFLSKLDLKVKIKKADEFTIPRISQLILKTNQFNLTTRRYQEEDIRNFSKNKDMIVGCAEVHDKFGDNGITGAFIVRKDTPLEWTIDTFLLSCRVMGRGVEYAIMDYIQQEAKRVGVKIVKAQYVPTKKNKPCEEFLPKCSFAMEGDQWIRAPDVPIKVPNYLEVATA